MAHSADAAVRYGIDGHHRRQVRRVHLGQRVLGASGIARAEGADLAVGPILAGDPLHDVEAVLRDRRRSSARFPRWHSGRARRWRPPRSRARRSSGLRRRRRPCCRECASRAPGTAPAPVCRRARGDRCRLPAIRRRASGSSRSSERPPRTSAIGSSSSAPGPAQTGDPSCPSRPPERRRPRSRGAVSRKHRSIPCGCSIRLDVARVRLCRVDDCRERSPESNRLPPVRDALRAPS